MQNFSPLGNFINNFLQQQLRPTVTILPGSTVLTPTTGEPTQTPINQPPQTLLQQQAAALQQQQLETMEMSSAERAVLVKDLLKLPENLQQLVTANQLQNANAKAMPNPLLLGENLNVEQLMRLIQTNGKEALAKLAQLNGMMSKGNVNTKQLQELQYIISSCMPNANMSNTQFLKNLILLYLPWLPVGENNNFDIDFTSSKEEEGGGESEDTITILIQTVNYGNVKVVLVLEAANKVNLIINCAKSFPKELLQAKVKENSKEFKLETSIAVNEHEKIEQSELNKDRKVHMSGAAVLNPYILLMAHAVIREVIEIDKSQTLVSKRKMEAENQ